MLSLFFLSFLGAAVETAPVPGQAIFRTEAAFDYVYMEYQGSYSAIPQAISTFMSDFFKQELTAVGPLLGIYINYAKDMTESELRWQIALAVQPGTEPTLPLKKATFPEQEVIYILRKGSYDSVGETYALLHKTIADNGYLIHGPAIERYLSDPAKVAPQDLETEILIPVKKQ